MKSILPGAPSSQGTTHHKIGEAVDVQASVHGDIQQHEIVKVLAIKYVPAQNTSDPQDIVVNIEITNIDNKSTLIDSWHSGFYLEDENSPNPYKTVPIQDPNRQEISLSPHASTTITVTFQQDLNATPTPGKHPYTLTYELGWTDPAHPYSWDLSI